MKALNRQGEPFVLEGSGMLARCIQHEIDHLHVILFVDHVHEPWLYEERTHRKINLLEIIRMTKQSN